MARTQTTHDFRALFATAAWRIETGNGADDALPRLLLGIRNHHFASQGWADIWATACTRATALAEEVGDARVVAAMTNTCDEDDASALETMDAEALQSYAHQIKNGTTGAEAMASLASQMETARGRIASRRAERARQTHNTLVRLGLARIKSGMSNERASAEFLKAEAAERRLAEFGTTIAIMRRACETAAPAPAWARKLHGPPKVQRRAKVTAA